jgi:hypothetical protein
MNNMSPDIRAAISDFLNGIQGDRRPFALSEAREAIRRVFPALEISNSALDEVIASEASAAGFDIEYDADKLPRALRQRAIERWDNEGGAPGRTADDRREAEKVRRRKANDAKDVQRRSDETKERHRLI